MAKLKVGAKAPDFKLSDKDGSKISLKDLKAEFTVVYFYPKDDTPGCTIEAQGFNKDISKYKKLDISVIGISGGDEKTKSKFCNKFNLKIILLSDSDFKISKKYNSFGKKTFMGKTYDGIFRKTFILNDKRKIIKIYDKVTPETHSREILEEIKNSKKEQ